MLCTYLPPSIYVMGAGKCDFTCGTLLVRADIVFIWFLSTRFVKLYDLSAQHRNVVFYEMNTYKSGTPVLF